MKITNTRTYTIVKNITGSFLLKCISIFVSLQVVPLTINYINPTRYGIWLTLSSIIAWLSYFDLGFTQGFRNKFAEAIARTNITLAKEYVSTTYAILSILFSFILAITLIANYYIDWSTTLNISQTYNDELKLVFALLACFFCLNMVASVFTTMLTANQEPALASLIQTLGQLFAFGCIYFLTQNTDGNLVYLALAFAGIPCICLILFSILLFIHQRYQKFMPTFGSIRFSLAKDILGLGSQFFLIMVSLLIIFQFINLILVRIEGPDAVTQYNIAYKYFNVCNMVAIIILTPFWSAFTDAYTKNDFEWMQKIQKKLEYLLIMCIPIMIVMVICAQPIYQLWIGDEVEVPLSVSIATAIYIFSQIAGNTYMYPINGTGKIRIQTIVYVSFSIIALPLLNFSCKEWGTEGILLIPSIVYLLQTIVIRFQLYKIIRGKALGIWNQ